MAAPVERCSEGCGGTRTEFVRTEQDGCLHVYRCLDCRDWFAVVDPSVDQWIEENAHLFEDPDSSLDPACR